MNKKKISILLVEGKKEEVQIVTKLLEKASLNYTLHIADSLYESFLKVQNNAIDIVLLALNLPDSVGFKTLTNFLDKVSNLPVIVVTNTNNEIVGNQAIKAGAQDYLVKGQFDGKLIGRSVRYAVQRYSINQKITNKANDLSLNEKRFVEAQEMAKFGNWELDIVSNEMKWTDVVYKIFSLQPNSFRPTLSEYMNYVHIEDKELVDDYFDRATKDSEIHVLEHRLLIGRSIKHVALRCKIHYEEMTQKIMLVGVIQDISERKLTEKLIFEKNITKQNSIISQQALTEVGFNIRTPLSSIVNLLYLLENGGISSQQRELVEGLKVSVDDLSLSLNNLLNFSIMAGDQLELEEERFKIQDFLQSNHKSINIRAEKAKLKLNFDIPEKLPQQIISDPRKLTVVLNNLVNYAITNSDENNLVDIQTNLTALNDTDAEMTFTIKDGSNNMNAGKIKDLVNSEKLLEVYNPDEDGALDNEMNVAIALRVVNILNGSLRITQTTENGLMFKLNIPVKIAKQVVMNDSDKPNAPIRILLVEDHFLNQIATRKVLKSWSELITIDIAENGLIAVEKFREHGYDLILMDIQMPVMNGLEAATRIREASQVPIIALTANATKQEQNKCAKVGMNDYISKPFQPQELYSTIMNLLAEVQASSAV